MDADQRSIENPFGMDEECANCPALCETRERIVHGYGDVGADFAVIGEEPTARAEETGVPFTGEDGVVLDSLEAVGLIERDRDAEEDGEVDEDGDHTDTDDADADERPATENVYLTYLTRCRHPERGPTDDEVRNCEPYRSGELRMINPEIIVPVGQRALEALAFEYTTESAEDLDVAELHATTVRGRGFEIVPMRDPAEQTPADTEAFVEHVAELLGTDYRQTKGRRGSLESGRGSDE